MLHWDGATWILFPHPAIKANSVTLYDIVAISADDIWAVGTYSTEPTTSDNGMKTLTSHWNGSVWEVIPSPNGCKGMNTLVAVSATGPNDVWAVGNCTDDEWDTYTASRRTLVEHWDGTRWTIVPSPNPTFRHILSAVAAIAPDDVWAVGSHTDDNRGLIDRILALLWVGNQWNHVPSPNPSTD